MARLPRLLIDRHVHLLSHRGQQGLRIAFDDVDRTHWLELLRATVRREHITLYAWVLTDDRFELLAAAEDAHALSRMMQSLARDYAAAYNRRHGRQGSLWQGRYRAAVIEPGEWLLRGMRRVDALGGPVADPRWSSRAVHEGSATDAMLATPAVYWALGNTPFERELAYRACLQLPLTAVEQAEFDAALAGGWALGTREFVVRLASQAVRPVVPRPRGRPRRATL